MTAERQSGTHLELFWIPLGAGTPVVQVSGWIYEFLYATRHRRERRHLYHVALIATMDGEATVIEVAPVPDDDGQRTRGVVGTGPVGSKWLGPIRLFRYEVRRWTSGVVPDLTYAVDSPVRLTDDVGSIRDALRWVEQVPTPVWGRDEFGTGDMWNSNSVISWTLSRAGLVTADLAPPPGGRAPGWDAGLRVADDQSTTLC